MLNTLENILPSLQASGDDLEGRVYAKWFDAECALVIEDCENPADSPGQIQTLLGFLNWDDELRTLLVEATKRYCLYFCDYIGEDLPNDYTAVPILNDCELLNVMILPLYQGHRYVRAELNCAWEPEHGMEWVVRDDAVPIYVGPFEMQAVSYLEQDRNTEWNFALA